MESTKFKTVNEYFLILPQNIRDILEKLRNTIKQAAPEAQECISYNMPAFKLNKVLVYYAVFKTHIGFYPTPKSVEIFKEELAGYKTSKGAIQFPIDKPIPMDLVRRIVEFRAKEDMEQAGAKATKI